MLQEFAKGALRTEIMSVMPSSSNGGPGEVTSYLEVVNWLLRAMLDEAALATHVEELTQAHQEEVEDELSLPREFVNSTTSAAFFIHTLW